MDSIISLLTFLTPYGPYAYFFMFAILIACGFGFPMPEDIILVTGGILAARGVTGFWETVTACMAGVIIGDGVVFLLGRTVGPKIKKTRFFKRVMTPERETKVAHWFDKYGDKVIFFARFAPGLRMPLFLSAGIYQVSFAKFFFLDGFAAIISVPAWIWAGEFFGNNLEELGDMLEKMQVGLYGILIGLLAILGLVYYLKKRFKPKNL